MPIIRTPASSAPSRMSVSDLVYPVVIPHRGAGSALVPENTMAAFRMGMQFGLGIVDGGDLQVTADGVLMSVHDATVNYSLPATGNVNAFTSMAFQAAPSFVMDPETWFGGAVYTTATGLRAAPWEQIAIELGNRVVLTPEIKDTAATPILAESIKRHRMQKSVIVQAFDYAALNTFRTLCPGTQTCVLINATASSGLQPSEVVAMGHEWIGIDYSWNLFASKAAAFAAAGINVLAYTVNRQVEYDACVAAGAKIIASDNPLYCGRLYSKYRANRDRFSMPTWDHGMIPNFGAVPYINSGWSFTGTNRLTCAGNTQNSMLLGSISPVVNAASLYTIDFNLTYEALGTDVTRWAGLWFAAPQDYGYNDSGQPVDNGYMVFLRANGQMLFYRRVNGTATQLGATVTTTALTAGQTVPMRVAVTPTTITATRVDTANALTVTDSTHRGGYVTFFKQSSVGLSVSIDSVIVT